MESSKNNTEKTMKISVAKLGDVEGIQDVFYLTWLDTYPNKENGITVDDIEYKFKDRLTEEGIKRATEKIVNPPEGSTTFVSKEDNKIIGVCKILVSPEENRLGAIYILPEYQGKGVGKKLWEQAIKYFNFNKDIFVSVAVYNTNAIEFYKRLGFKDTGKRWNDEKFKMKSGATIPEMEMVINSN